MSSQHCLSRLPVYYAGGSDFSPKTFKHLRLFILRYFLRRFGAERGLAYLPPSWAGIFAGGPFCPRTREEKFRKLAVDELAHRLKNKLATIQAIVSLRLREHPQVRDEIASSLDVLSATDDMITKMQGQGASISDILSTELAPYDVSRISMEGPDCLLSPKLALTMSLLVHELATNAAKYGALSVSAGKLSINWSLSDLQLILDWRETGGPLVNPPSHGGFGTRLFLRALEPFSGKVQATFAPSGLACKLSSCPSRTCANYFPRGNRQRIRGACDRRNLIGKRLSHIAASSTGRRNK